MAVSLLFTVDQSVTLTISHGQCALHAFYFIVYHSVIFDVRRRCCSLNASSVAMREVAGSTPGLDLYPKAMCN
jgi:hypothetical protein